jgi:hypothetical protein
MIIFKQTIKFILSALALSILAIIIFCYAACYIRINFDLLYFVNLDSGALFTEDLQLLKKIIFTDQEQHKMELVVQLKKYYLAFVSELKNNNGVVSNFVIKKYGATLIQLLPHLSFKKITLIKLTYFISCAVTCVLSQLMTRQEIPSAGAAQFLRSTTLAYTEAQALVL